MEVFASFLLLLLIFTYFCLSLGVVSLSAIHKFVAEYYDFSQGRYFAPLTTARILYGTWSALMLLNLVSYSPRHPSSSFNTVVFCFIFHSSHVALRSFAHINLPPPSPLFVLSLSFLFSYLLFFLFQTVLSRTFIYQHPETRLHLLEKNIYEHRCKFSLVGIIMLSASIVSTLFFPLLLSSLTLPSSLSLYPFLMFL